MSVSNTACIRCEKNIVSEPKDECGLCRSWQHKSCKYGWVSPYSTIIYLQAIDSWICSRCYLNSTPRDPKEDNKILMLRLLRKQLQEANNILLSGNKALYKEVDGLRNDIKKMSSSPVLQKILDTLEECSTVRPDVSQEGNNIEENNTDSVKTQNKLAEAQHVQNSLLAECVVSLNKMVAAQQVQNQMVEEQNQRQNQMVEELSQRQNQMAEEQNQRQNLIEVQNQRQNELLAESVATQNKLLQALEMLQTPPPQDAVNSRVAQIEQAIMKMQEQFTYLLGNLKGE